MRFVIEVEVKRADGKRGGLPGHRIQEELEAETHQEGDALWLQTVDGGEIEYKITSVVVHDAAWPPERGKRWVKRSGV